MERRELVVGNRSQLATVDCEDLRIQPRRQRRIEQRGVGGVAIEFRGKRDEARAVPRVPSPACMVNRAQPRNSGSREYLLSSRMKDLSTCMNAESIK